MDIGEIITGVIIAVISTFVVSVSKLIYKRLKKVYNYFYGMFIVVVELICLITASVNFNIDIFINDFFSKRNLLNFINLITIVIATISIIITYMKHPYKKDSTYQ